MHMNFTVIVSIDNFRKHNLLKEVRGGAEQKQLFSVCGGLSTAAFHRAVIPACCCNARWFTFFLFEIRIKNGKID